MSVAIQIADALVAELNGGAFGQPFTAERQYVPVFDLPDLNTLHVTVVPQSLEVTGLSRAAHQHDYALDIGIQKKLATLEQAEIDALMDLVQSLSDALAKKRLAGCPEAVWVKTENVPIFAPDHLEELRQFTSVLTVTYRVAR